MLLNNICKYKDHAIILNVNIDLLLNGNDVETSFFSCRPSMGAIYL